ncbi:triose-phosphate isomerase [Patescibacteria group bacterium]
MKKDKSIVVANWKMNPQSFKEAKILFSGIKSVASKLVNIQTVICPPSVYLNEISKMYSGHRIAFGGQDCFWEEKGSFTGEVSSGMLKSSGANYVILGHSERRALGETDEQISKKVRSALDNKLKVVLCIGEKERDEDGNYLDFLKNEIEASLSLVSKNGLSNLIIAYEPIWAVGNKSYETATPNDIHEITIFIKKVLSDIYGRKDAVSVKVVYGGSANYENVYEIMVGGNVDGILVGRESLNAESFNKIISVVNNINFE